VTIASDKVVYAATATTTPVLLHASVEKMYDTTLGLGDFRAEDGDYVRVIRMRVGDQFATTAFSGEVAKGDLMKIDTGANAGMLVVDNAVVVASANFVCKVVNAAYKLGFGASSLGFTAQSAVVVEVVSLGALPAHTHA
jgi:hypothetical protein